MAQILGVDLDSEPKEAEAYNAELRKYEDVYIYIGTNFKRTTQPIFALALLQGTRYMKIPDKSIFCSKGLDEQLKIAGDIARDNYKKGAYLAYIWKRYRLQALFAFNTNGEFMNQEINEQVTTIRF